MPALDGMRAEVNTGTCYHGRVDVSRYLFPGIVGLILLLVLWFILIYNGLIKWRYIVKNAWAQIDVQLKRRYDLIPNLVETVKAYASHERQLFESIAQARAAALGAQTPKEVETSDAQLAPAIRSLFAVVENYPQLKADQNFRKLMEELTATENKVAFARQYYNDSVQVYNTKTQEFPAAFIAHRLNFEPQDFLEARDFEREVQRVKF